MNPNHLIKAEFVPEFGPIKHVLGWRPRNEIGAQQQTIEISPTELEDDWFDLSDRATFLLALDVLMARKKGDSFELDADGGWIVWCGAYKYGDSLFAFNAQDPIHALKLALEATK